MEPDGKFDYFIEQTNMRLRLIDNKLDDLLKFKWQIIGGSVLLSIVVTFAFQVVIYLMPKT